MLDTNEAIYRQYETLGISKEVLDFGTSVEKELKERFDKIDTNAEYNQLKVIAAMQKNKVSAECFQASSGYGYNDLGRDTLERVYADCFGAEDALVRPQITCGTHALALALMSNLRPGDELLSPVGKPYDTLEEVIGIRPSKGSLAEYGITYAQVDLLPDGEFDYNGIKKAINEKTKLVTIQRSKGYATRPTLSVKRIGELIAFVKSIKPDVICMVDNCYGEFVETIEPTNVGADLMVGSLIKNPGGGLAPAGGYIVGKKKYVENAAYRLLSPGLGKEVGATLGVNGSFYQGFFLAPTVTAAALKGAVFAANVYEKLGFAVVPNGTESRHDIIQAVELGSREPIFDIVVSAAKKSTFSRLSQNETAKECYQLGFFKPENADAALAALDMMDFEGVEKVRQRVQQNGTLAQKLAQMQDQMVQMAAVIEMQGGGQNTAGGLTRSVSSAFTQKSGKAAGTKLAGLGSALPTAAAAKAMDLT